MLSRHFLLGGAALALLGWRIWDPKGSYATLYDASHVLTEPIAGYEFLTRFVSIVLVDQFNGLMLGVAVTAFLYFAMSSLNSLVQWPFARRRKNRVPLSRYAVPRRRQPVMKRGLA